MRRLRDLRLASLSEYVAPSGDILTRPVTGSLDDGFIDQVHIYKGELHC